MSPPENAAAPDPKTAGSEQIRHSDSSEPSGPVETNLDETEARQITNFIRQHAEITLVYVKKAYTGRAWIAMGYASWDDYCSTEFGSHIRLPRGDRRDAVLELREAGMSTRAIASATGASRTTVISDIRSAEVVRSVPPDPGGDASPPIRRPRIQVHDNKVTDIRRPRIQVHDKKVTGTDGKQYKQTAPRQRPVIRRSPVTDDIPAVLRSLRRLNTQLEGLVNDDRFGRNRESIAKSLATELHRLLELIGRVQS